jgi:hypothetical protein
MKAGDYVYYKDGQLATVDFVHTGDEGFLFIAITIVDSGDELMCDESEVTLATNEATELLYESNQVPKGTLDKT